MLRNAATTKMVLNISKQSTEERGDEVERESYGMDENRKRTR